MSGARPIDRRTPDARAFLTTKTPIDGPLADPAAVVAETFRRLGTDTVGLLQIHNMLRCRMEEYRDAMAA